MATGYSSVFGSVKKRKAFFSFHYDDIMRVNNVRNAWKITHPDSPTMRSFYDSSLWESRKLEGPEAVKRLIREGVEYTSAVCVLIGTSTWDRRWVRYEIARAIIDGRGLLGVHINGLAHHQRRVPDTLGPNPLAYMASARSSSPVSFRSHNTTCSRRRQRDGFATATMFRRYSDRLGLPTLRTATSLRYRTQLPLTIIANRTGTRISAPGSTRQREPQVAKLSSAASHAPFGPELRVA